MYLLNVDYSIAWIIVWLVIFLIAIILELLTNELITIWFSGGAIISLILACFNVVWWIQVIIFLIVSIVLLVLTRPILKRKFNLSEKTNADSLIGKEIIITKDVSYFMPGEGKIRDIIWTCKVEEDITIPSNSIALIKDIKGNHLVVTKKGEK